jgi:hypothetical protein
MVSVTLIREWKNVLLYAWSIRVLALSILFGAVELALPFLQGVLPLRPGTFAVLIFFTNIVAVITRLLAQRKTVPPKDDEHDGVGA